MDTSKRTKESPMQVTQVNRKVFQVPPDKMTDREANLKDKQIKMRVQGNKSVVFLRIMAGWLADL